MHTIFARPAASITCAVLRDLCCSHAFRFAPQLFKNKPSTGGYSAFPSSASSSSSSSPASPSPTPIIATGEVLAKWSNTNRNARRRLPRVHIDDLFAIENAEYLDGMTRMTMLS
jgi:hypothetical protein